MSDKPCPFCLPIEDMPEDWSVEDLCPEHLDHLEICNNFARMFLSKDEE